MGLVRDGPAPLRKHPALWEYSGMIFQQIVNEETGCLSYLIGCGQAGRAAVVDPGRDRVDEYVALARRKGLVITDIFETHVHADHVSGNQALAGKCGARIRIHPAAEAAYPIGFERRFNPALRVDAVDAFVTRLMTGLPPKPPNFDRIIAKNRARMLPSTGDVAPRSAAQVRDILAKGGCVLDVRSPEEHGDGHIPGSINVWIESPQFSTRAGWFLPADAPIVLVAASPTDLARAAQGLARIGLDDVAGYLQWGMTDWRSQSLPVANVAQVTVHDLATMREERPELVAVDVRELFEWEEGHIEGAVHLPMGEAVRRMAELPADRPKAVLCAGGLRSSTVISALSREGMTGWYNVSGGMTAWVKAGYATVRPAGGRAGA